MELVASVLASYCLRWYLVTVLYYRVCCSDDGQCLGIDDAGNLDAMQWLPFLITIVLNTLSMKLST